MGMGDPREDWPLNSGARNCALDVCGLKQGIGADF